MAATLAAPRYSAEDLETRSIHSVAPSYFSEAPSYHSTAPHNEAVPPYTPSTQQNNNQNNNTSARRQTIGLPPVPSAPLVATPNLHNFRLPTWSMHNAPAARQYHSVIERRANAERNGDARRPTLERLPESPQDENASELRPLEDPYLVGEQAAAQARRERIARETGEDILIREDRHWDWLIVQMKDWDERERSWARFRREVEVPQRKRLFRRIGGRRFL